MAVASRKPKAWRDAYAALVPTAQYMVHEQYRITNHRMTDFRREIALVEVVAQLGACMAVNPGGYGSDQDAALDRITKIIIEDAQEAIREAGPAVFEDEVEVVALRAREKLKADLERIILAIQVSAPKASRRR